MYRPSSTRSMIKCRRQGEKLSDQVWDRRRWSGLRLLKGIGYPTINSRRAPFRDEQHELTARGWLLTAVITKDQLDYLKIR
jgi:hypothetical protein